jgi:hypothetical protein
MIVYHPPLTQRAQRLLCLAAACLLAAGCSSPDPKPSLAADPVDMSGYWEVDYARSDNLQARFSALVRQMRDDAARRAAAAERGQPVAGGGGASREALLGLAQMAELVTASQLLEVEQSRVAIRVEREGNFSLSCDYGSEGGSSNEYGVGRELCYWDGRQLVFYIDLPDGLNIAHRLSLAADGRSLAILTTLYSSAVSTPFSVRRVYRRYVPGSRGYRCTETLTRGRVCTTESK